MFDVGFFELVIIALVALLVLGPEKLLHMAKVVGRMVGKLRHQFMSVKEEIDREIRIDEMRRHLAKEEQALRTSLQNNAVSNSVSNAAQEAHNIFNEAAETGNRIGGADTATGNTGAASVANATPAPSSTERSQS